MHFALGECPELGRNRGPKPSETARNRPKPPEIAEIVQKRIDHGTRTINKVSLLWVLRSVKFY